MFSELTAKNKVVGLKQVQKALKEKKALKVYIALDADSKIVKPITDLCEKADIQTVKVKTMRELGQAVGIDVGASVAALVSE